LEHKWAKCIDVEGDYIKKERPLVGFPDYRKYTGPRTFLLILVHEADTYISCIHNI
jgi:hypothetical protein